VPRVGNHTFCIHTCKSIFLCSVYIILYFFCSIVF